MDFSNLTGFDLNQNRLRGTTHRRWWRNHIVLRQRFRRWRRWISYGSIWTCLGTWQVDPQLWSKDYILVVIKKSTTDHHLTRKTGIGIATTTERINQTKPDPVTIPALSRAVVARRYSRWSDKRTAQIGKHLVIKRRSWAPDRINIWRKTLWVESYEKTRKSEGRRVPDLWTPRQTGVVGIWSRTHKDLTHGLILLNWSASLPQHRSLHLICLLSSVYLNSWDE